MSPLRTETACAATWVALMVDHRCTGAQGHAGAHVCACGATRGDLPPETVARMAAALADIVDRHTPDVFSASTQGLACAWCSRQAGIPVPWPCMDRGAVGDLMPDPSNRLLPH